MADTMTENSELARKIAEEIQAANHCPAVCFTLEPGEPGIFGSKVGGTPYLPHDMDWPTDTDGAAMGLLAQVDCAGLGGLADFPATGLLQFFIALNDAWGLNFGNQTEQLNFRVLYHEAVDPSVTEEEVKAKGQPHPEDYGSPVFQVCRIVPQPPVEQAINEHDYRAWVRFLQKWNELQGTDFKTPWDHYQATKISDVFPAPKGEAPWHQLGGYPYFTQEDPRGGGEYEDLDVLLFQLDSDMRKRNEGGDLVLWGDCGVGNFFISREALKRRDFSRVCYNWDCC